MKIRVWVPVFVGILLPSIHAQSTSGTIQGIVRDSSGATVEGATVTAREAQTNTSAQASSMAAGLYEFLNLRPGLYEVTALKPGFAANKTGLMPLEVNQTRRADFTLSVAGRADTAIVLAQVPEIDTEDSTLSDSRDSSQLARLPLNYRGAGGTALVAFMTFPGIRQDRFGRMAISGALPSQADFTVDGISIIDVNFHLPQDNVPSTEMIRELNVSSANSDVAFGPLGEVTLSTRGGTNQVHGSLFWYHQNGAFDANTYNSPVKPPKVFNTFGGSLGGPVVLPALYRGLSRTFFFFDYEGNRQRAWELEQISVPTAAMREGELNGLPGGAAVDPANGAPFPANRIPLEKISSVARVLLTRYYPLPNRAGADISNNYYKTASDNQDLDSYDIRLDHTISPRQNMFIRWSSKGIDSVLEFTPTLPASRNPLETRNFVAAHTYAPSSALSNEFRFGFSRNSAPEYFPINGKESVAALGLQGLDLRNVGDSGGFPYFDFSDTTGFEPIGKGRDQFVASRTYQFTNTLSWIRGRHTLKFSGELRYIGSSGHPTHGNGDDFGTFRFLSNTFSGNAFADLLLGLPASSTTAVLGPDVEESANHFAASLGDTWKVGRRLVLDFGLRWEVHPPLMEESGNSANFDPSTGNVIVPDHGLPPAAGFLASIHACTSGAIPPGCTQVLTASQAGLPQGLRRTYYGDWDPRLGFAWRPAASGKTVVRGGIGVYTQTLLGGASSPVGIAASDVRNFTNGGGGQPPLFTFPNVSPGPAALGTIATASFNPGVALTLKDPRSLQWTLTTERELLWNTSVRASYVGLQSAGLPVRVELNQVPASTRPFSPSSRPFQQWVSLVSIQNLGFSNYQGLRLELSRRFRSDLFFQASYEHSKDLGLFGGANSLSPAFTPVFPFAEVFGLGLTDRFNSRYDRGNLPGARNNRLLLTALVPLPFGKGRAIGQSWGRMRDGLLGGWELSTVALVESGLFQTPIVGPGQDQSNTNIGTRFPFGRPDRIGDGNLPDPTRDRYYDPSAFAFVPKGAGRFGNAGAGILEGPSTAAIAAGLAKTFRVTERLRLRTEATFTNLPNHPNFAPPGVAVGTPAFGRLVAVERAENSGNRTGQVGVRLEF